MAASWARSADMTSMRSSSAVLRRYRKVADLAWMLTSLIAGLVLGMLALAVVGGSGLLVVAYVSGWAMAQRDHNYQRHSRRSSD